MKVFDKLDQPITPGCFIGYAIREGSSGAFRIGKVLAVKSEPRPEYRSWGPLEVVSIMVRGVDDAWSKLEINSKPGVLSYPERIIVLQREQVPQLYLDLLDPVAVPA